MSKEYGEDLSPRVAVIVGFFNGNLYFREQITSILNQSHKNFQIVIFDDCSDDRVDVEALNLHPDEQKKIQVIVRDENVGFAKNFLMGLAYIGDNFDYYAFSDQDDIWDQDKVESALLNLSSIPDTTPSLYCGRTLIVDEAGELKLGVSPLFAKPPSFANALVQSIGGGNTMVFNRCAKNLITASFKHSQVVAHDWWCYLIVSGAGGIVIYDPQPYLRYRQHAMNIVGSNSDWMARFIRMRGVFKGRFKRWNDTNSEALFRNIEILTEDNQNLLKNFHIARNANFFKRLVLFKRSGIYRQTFLGNVGLMFGILINRI